MRDEFEKWASGWAPDHWRFHGYHIRDGKWHYQTPVVQMAYEAWQAGRATKQDNALNEVLSLLASMNLEELKAVQEAAEFRIRNF